MNHGFKHRLSIEAGGIGAWERNLHTHVISISPMLARIMGLPPECCELAAAEWQAMVIPEDRPLLADAAVEQALLSDQPFDLEFRLIRPDGQMICLISRGCFVRDDHGRPLKAVGVCFLNKASNDVLKSMSLPRHRCRRLQHGLRIAH